MMSHFSEREMDDLAAVLPMQGQPPPDSDAPDMLTNFLFLSECGAWQRFKDVAPRRLCQRQGRTSRRHRPA